MGKNNIVAHLDVVKGGCIAGWAHVPGDSDNKLLVSVFSKEGKEMVQIVANEFRQDLLKAKLGGGECSFNLEGFFYEAKYIRFTNQTDRSYLDIPLEIKELGIDLKQLKISPDDHIFRFILNSERWNENPQGATSYYFEDGEDSAKKLSMLVDEYNVKSDSPLELLEFASGYGRVTRFIDTSKFKITSCDIHDEAVSFITENFDASAVISSSSPDELDLGNKFDVVFALSFFSHIPESTFGKWIKALYLHLKKDGLLIFTTHGNVSNDLLIKTKLTGGYAFIADSEQKDIAASEYGTTVVTHEYVENVVKNQVGTSLLDWKEGFWWGHQDLYIIKKQ